jgi:hypothetical protein
MTDDPIAEILELSTEVVEPEENLPVTQVIEVQASDHHDHVDEDFEEARRNIEDIFALGMESLEEFQKIASQAQHPRAFEVLSTMIKTMTDTAQAKLYAATEREKIHRLKGKTSTAGDGPKTVNNTVYVGTTADLQKLLEDHDIKVGNDIHVEEDL